MVTAQQVAPLPAAIAGVVVGGPAAPPDVSHQLPTALLYVLGLRGRQQCLDLLEKVVQLSSVRPKLLYETEAVVFSWKICSFVPLHAKLGESGNLWPTLLTPTTSLILASREMLDSTLWWCGVNGN